MVKSDAELVMEAEKHLLDLFADPFYAEALRRIRRSHPESIRSPQGLISKLGGFAAKAQWRNPPPRRRGRPPDIKKQQEMDRLSKIFDAFERRSAVRTVGEFARMVMRARTPSAPERRLKIDAKRLAKRLLEFQRRKSGNSP